jgi:hypothetical protein
MTKKLQGARQGKRGVTQRVRKTEGETNRGRDTLQGKIRRKRKRGTNKEREREIARKRMGRETEEDRE